MPSLRTALRNDELNVRKVIAKKMIMRVVIFSLLAFWLISYVPAPANALDVVTGDGIMLYGVNGNSTPQWRTYTQATTSFAAAANTVSGGTGTSFMLRTSPTKQEAVAGYINSSGTLQIMCYNGSSWSNEWSISVGGVGTTRRFDIGYETNSGDVVVLYSANIATTNELAYRTKAGSSACGSANWSSVTSLDPVRTSGTVHWVSIAWDRRGSSNLLSAIWADSNSDLSSMVWSGTGWGNEPTAALETSLEVVAVAQDVKDFDLEYESTSGDLMVVWANSAGANGTNGVRAATCTGGTSSCTWSAVSTPATFADDATNLDISANPGNDEMIFASIGNAGADLQIGYWSGSAWTNNANVDTSAGTPAAGTQLVSTGWLTSGSTVRSIVVYDDNTAQGASRVNYYSGLLGVFTAATDFIPSPQFTSPVPYFDVQVDPFNQHQLILTVVDGANDLFAKRLSMSSLAAFTWTDADGGAALDASTAVQVPAAASFAYWRLIPAPTFAQSSYRFYANNNSTNVGAALAAQDTVVNLAAAGGTFRLRMLLHVGANQLIINNQNFKLQFAGKGTGTCASPAAGTPANYTDVTAATVIAFNNNSTPADGANLIANAADPTHGADTVVNQTYEELNNFANTTAAIPSGRDGKWDFSLIDNGAAAGATYCLRIVKSDGTALSTYNTYPELTTAAGGTLSVDIVDAAGSPVASPSYSMNAATSSYNCQTITGTFGTVGQKIRVTNTTTTPGWILSIAASSVTNTWTTGSIAYDFNDSGSSGCTDSAVDADTLAGSLDVDAVGGVITPQSGCSSTNLTLSTGNDFEQGITDSISLITASGSAQTGCYWDLTGVGLSQKIPADQKAGSYSINMVLTVVAN